MNRLVISSAELAPGFSAARPSREIDVLIGRACHHEEAFNSRYVCTWYVCEGEHLVTKSPLRVVKATVSSTEDISCFVEKYRVINVTPFVSACSVVWGIHYKGRAQAAVEH